MITIVYVSAGTASCDQTALKTILEQSRRNNQQAGITGMLLCIDGNFMQALEGPDDAVQQVRERIAKDPRHTKVTTLIEEPVTERAFPHWSMDFRGIMDLAPEQAQASQAFIHDVLDPTTAELEPATNALRLLTSFRRTMR